MRVAVDELRQSAEYCGQRVSEAVTEMDEAASTSITDGAVDKISDAFNKLKDNVENNFTPKIEQSFDTWLRKSNEDFSLMLEIGQGSLNTLQTGFSDLGMSIIGLGDDIRDVFSSLGNSIIRMFMDIAAKWLAMKAIMGITSAIGGLFSSGSSAGVSSIASSSFNASGLSLGHSEGIDYVPETGWYKLHEGERAVPKYDAAKELGGNVTVVNYVTTDAINAAIAQKPDTVINVINADTVRNGTTRKIYKRFG
jgi:lambda family phage tail tape measure protein